MAGFDVWQSGVRRTASRAAGVLALVHIVNPIATFNELTTLGERLLQSGVIVLLAAWAATALAGKASLRFVVVLVASLPVVAIAESWLGAELPGGIHALVPVIFATSITGAASVVFGYRYFLAFAAIAATFLVSSIPIALDDVDVLVVTGAAGIAFWALASSVWTVAVRADSAHEMVLREHERRAEAEAREEAQDEARRVLHDSVIAGLMVAQFADLGYDKESIRVAAAEALESLEKGVTR